MYLKKNSELFLFVVNQWTGSYANKTDNTKNTLNKVSVSLSFSHGMIENTSMSLGETFIGHLFTVAVCRWWASSLTSRDSGLRALLLLGQLSLDLMGKLVQVLLHTLHAEPLGVKETAFLTRGGEKWASCSKRFQFHINSKYTQHQWFNLYLIYKYTYQTKLSRNHMCDVPLF